MSSVHSLLAAAIVAWSVGSCGAPPPPAPPKPPALDVKTYVPLGIKADAKAPHQAVLLGTDDKGGSTILPLTPGQATVDTMTAGRVSVQIAAAPNASSAESRPILGAQVVTVNGVAAIPDPAWRVTVWTAALVAAATLDKDVSDFTFRSSASGAIDNSSAAGLVGAGLLAALTGHAVDPTATLTGTLAPDGTLGPVANIHDKLRGAIDAGKRRIGYPVGMRYGKTASGEVFDLHALAKQHGAQAIEVADIYSAYRVLTGKELPGPIPVSKQDMALDPTTTAALDTKYKQWQQRLAAEWAPILQLESAGRLPQLLTFLRDTSKKLAQAAERLHKRGRLGAAYARMFAAALYASTANQAYDVLSKVQANKIDEAVALLARHETLGDITRTVLTRIGEQQPQTLGGHLQMLAAYRAGLRGWVFEAFAIEAVASAKAQLKLLAGKSTAELGSDQTAATVVAFVVPTLLYVGKTTAETTLATEQLELPSDGDVAYTASLPNLERVALSFQSAGTVGIAHFDALVVAPYAKTAKLSDDDARRRVAVHEPDYLVGAMAARLDEEAGLPEQLQTAWGTSSLAWRLLSLAASQLAYASATELAVKYDALHADISTDGSGRVQKIAHEKAFARMLVSAERTARAHARAARVATGAIPVQAKLAYQNATVDQNGSLGERLDALAQFWASSQYSQTAVMLARN